MLPKRKPPNPGGNKAWHKGMAPVGGKPATTWQPPAVRAEFLTAKYQPHQLISMAKLISEGKPCRELSSQDAVVCIHLANILQMRDGVERERLYDRTFGKVPDRTINLNLNLDCTPEQLSQRAIALLQKIAPAQIEEIKEAEFEDVDELDMVDEAAASSAEVE